MDCLTGSRSTSASNTRSKKALAFWFSALIASVEGAFFESSDLLSEQEIASSEKIIKTGKRCFFIWDLNYLNDKLSDFLRVWEKIEWRFQLYFSLIKNRIYSI